VRDSLPGSTATDLAKINKMISRATPLSGKHAPTCRNALPHTLAKINSEARNAARSHRGGSAALTARGVPPHRCQASNAPAKSGRLLAQIWQHRQGTVTEHNCSRTVARRAMLHRRTHPSSSLPSDAQITGEQSRSRPSVNVRLGIPHRMHLTFD
jgi:hypothetical protein